MNRDNLAKKLVESSLAERKILLAENSYACDVELAKALQNLCYEVWTSEPQKVSKIVSTLELLTKINSDEEIKAILEWTKAIKNLVAGNLEKCLHWLDRSQKSFQSINKTHAAATTQISKLYALALLGRYDEAIACGLAAREIFLAHSDIYSVGKIEHNIGNLFWRRDLYADSEPYLASAYDNFLQIDDQRQMTMVENTQAFVKSLQNDFAAAEKFYSKAILRAEKNNFVVTQAEIETGLSNFYLFQGKPDLALKYMERSRRKYEVLKMPHRTAMSELEIADIYLELNLLPEAARLYESAAQKFSHLGMQFELGKCSLNLARTLFFSGKNELARQQIEIAEKIFRAEGNSIANASAQLFKAQILFLEESFSEAKQLGENALQIFADGKNLRYELFARQLLGEVSLAENNLDKADEIFIKTLSDAADNSSAVENLCLNALGKIALKRRKVAVADFFFRRAVEITEKTRSTLEAETFRMAFLGDKLAPYLEIAKINIKKRDFAEAFCWLERSRSRSLLDTFEPNSLPPNLNIEDKALLSKIEKIRDELNWFYNRLNRNSSSGLEARTELNQLKTEVSVREKKLAELELRLPKGVGAKFEFEIESLQNQLGEAVLVEYAIFDGVISAFIVTADQVFYCENLANEKNINEEVSRYLFQVKTARFVKNLSESNQTLALARVLRQSQNLYTQLVAPLEKYLRQAETIYFVPANQLHYLPFHALYDGEKFLAEVHQISYAPSGAVLTNCLQKEAEKTHLPLLVAFADDIIPKAETEIEKIGEIFPKARQLKGNKATLKNVREFAKTSNLLHFACHAKFRPDNPMFSALNLSGENLSVRDVHTIGLQNKSVVLSACETGLNKIENGEEILGLSRGFLSAGAKSLLLSFWTVDDDSTKDLMVDFYKNLQLGKSLCESLHIAQINRLKTERHPYFWSPFFLIGG